MAEAWDIGWAQGRESQGLDTRNGNPRGGLLQGLATAALTAIGVTGIVMGRRAGK